jgi:hypothetical protein
MTLYILVVGLGALIYTGVAIAENTLAGVAHGVAIHSVTNGAQAVGGGDATGIGSTLDGVFDSPVQDEWCGIVDE